MRVGPGWDCGRCRLDGPNGLLLHCRVSMTFLPLCFSFSKSYLCPILFPIPSSPSPNIFISASLLFGHSLPLFSLWTAISWFLVGFCGYDSSFIPSPCSIKYLPLSMPFSFDKGSSGLETSALFSPYRCCQTCWDFPAFSLLYLIGPCSDFYDKLSSLWSVVFPTHLD